MKVLGIYYNNAKIELNKHIDFLNVINLNNDIDRLKYIIFNEDQRNIFEFYAKPLIKKNNIHKSTTFNLRIKHSENYDEYKKLIDSYVNLKNDKIEINEKLLEYINNDLKIAFEESIN